MSGTAAVLDSTKFRRKAIRDLEKLKRRYLKVVESKRLAEEKPGVEHLEKAVRLLPGLLRTEERFLTSVEEAERREQLERKLEPLFTVLREVFGSEFDRKREEILEALETELKKNGSR